MICAMPFSPFDRGPFPRQRGRFRLIPVRTLVPNLITLLALCAGLTAIRLSTEGRMELAVAAIVFAAVLEVSVLGVLFYYIIEFLEWRYVGWSPTLS